jgi:hypothetical protein
MTQILFFAVDDDLAAVLADVERAKPVKYIRMGSSRTPEFETYLQGSQIPDLGMASTDSSSSTVSYLVTLHNVTLTPRAVQRTDGTSCYLMDQLINPDSISLTPAGRWTSDIVLHGRAASASDSTISKELMRCFQTAIRKRFKKIKAYWLGPTALEMLTSGKRLTISAQSPRTFDLTP